MTEDATFAKANTSPRQSRGKGRFIQALGWRLLLLLVGGGLAGLFGIVVATLFPDLNAEVPLVVRVLRLKQPQPSSAVRMIPSQLSIEQRQQLQSELQQLQLDLQGIRDRTSSLETQLGSDRANVPLEARLAAIEGQLQGKSLPITSQPTASVPGSPSDALKVTLPTDSLFKGTERVLLPEAPVILDAAIADLRNYQDATIHIAAHTDDAGEAKDNTEKSFLLARTVEQYLSTALGKQYRMVVIGYGESFPLVINDSDTNRQRNRRIELIVISH
ncbi:MULTISPECIES: OmpA family protein [Cyanophyceae]|uniref:OmpA family protein n=1 Tax=Cyanophyceae TaxID=3028117 RepID=UPI0016866955|nr:OmpA family protein [Trichocoleus sp. FACHB-69]MBD1932937.1 OmpA family protein [Trichocoleus sp. FACHB-69]